MHNIMAVSLILLMVGFPGGILFRRMKDEGVSVRDLTHGRPLVGACGVLVLGSLCGAEIMLLFQVLAGFFVEFMKQPPDPQFFIAPTLLNLVALLVFARWTCEAGDASMRLIKRDSMEADKTT